jgi:hypothetical protein
MLDEGNNFNLEPPAPQPPEESSNRTFLIVAGVLGALVLLTLVCIAGYVFLLSPRLTAQRSATQTAVSALNFRVAAQMTATAQAGQWTATPLPSPLPSDTDTPLPATDTPTTSPTPVVAQPSDTPTGFVTEDPLTETYVALQTQVGANQLTLTAQPTGMPKTGFADQVGLPGLVILALAFVAVILLARRLRRAPSK